MADLKTQITLKDRVSESLERIYKTMTRTTSHAEKLNSTMKKQGNTLDKTSKQAKYFVNAGNKIVDAQGRFVSATKIAELGLKKEDLALRKVNQTARKSSNIFGGLSGKMKSAFGGMGAMLGGIAIGGTAVSLGKQSDEFANMNARLKMINDGMNTTKELQTSIYLSAQKTGSAFNDVANGVAKMRMQAGEVFTNNAETLAFLETMNKSFVVGGASIEEQKSAMLQLTQAMASGKLQGDELRSLAETSPALIQAISSYLGVSRGEIKKLGAEGKLTADIVKNAMLSATDKINGEFEQMPKTWGRVWQEMKNYSLRALEPVLQKLNDFVNSERGERIIGAMQRIVDISANALSYLVDAILWVYDIFSYLFDFVKQNQDWLVPILKSIAIAVISFKVLNSTVGRAMSLFGTLQGGLRGLSGAFQVAKAGQLGLNTAMLGCPTTWIILGIAGIIASLYGLVAIINNVTGTSISATGIILGAVMFTYSFIYNIVAQLFNIIMAFAEFLVNVFIDPMYAIQMLWYNLVQAVGGYMTANLQVVDAFINGAVGLFFEFDYQAQTVWYNIAQGCYNMAGAIGMAIDSMINSVIGGIEGMLNSALSGINDMINAMNKIPKVDIPNIGTVSLGRASTGVSMQRAISNMATPTKKTWGGSNMSGAISSMMDGMAKPTTDKSVWNAPKMGYKNHLESASKGYGFGSGLATGFENMFKGRDEDFESLKNSPFELGELASLGLGDGLGGSKGGGRGGNGKINGGKLDSVGKIEDEIKIEDEVLKLVHDVANQEWQQKFVKLEPKIVTNIGEVKSERQYANILDDLNAKIVDAINNGADGI